MEVEEAIRNYLDQALMMQLATSSKDQPWVCNVWFAADDDFNIYWSSLDTRRHSQEIDKNDRVAASICLPRNQDDAPQAIQLTGLAEKLTDDVDIDHAQSVYAAKINQAASADKALRDPSNPVFYYRISAIQYKLFDALNFPDNPYQEWLPN